jgi:iron complex transport system substrate-binding protein
LGFGIWDFGFVSGPAAFVDQMVKLTAIVIGLVMVFYTAACQTAEISPVEPLNREVRDDLGRKVVVSQRIDRAVSLAPNLTEMIFAIGAGDRLVGVTTYCDYPAEAATKEKVGDTQTPNVERIIALRPQIVFVSTASQLEAFSRTLEEQGIAVYVTNPTTLEHVFQNLRQFGELFGRRDAAEELVTSLAARANAVRRKNQERPAKMRVFIQISNEPLFTIGKDSFLTELLEQAGGTSVTKDVPTGYPKLSKETAAALDPEVIILSDSDDNREPNAVFKDSKAVKTGRVHRINADIISRPGPRLVDALEEISRMLER